MLLVCDDRRGKSPVPPEKPSKVWKHNYHHDELAEQYSRSHCGQPRVTEVSEQLVKVLEDDHQSQYGNCPKGLHAR